MKKDWTDEEVEALLGVVIDLDLVAAIDGRRARNAQMFDTLSDELAAKGVRRTPEQCRLKLKKIRLLYKSSKMRQATPGAAATLSKHQHQLDLLLGGPPPASFHEGDVSAADSVWGVNIKSEDVFQPAITVEVARGAPASLLGPLPRATPVPTTTSCSAGDTPAARAATETSAARPTEVPAVEVAQSRLAADVGRPHSPVPAAPSEASSAGSGHRRWPHDSPAEAGPDSDDGLSHTPRAVRQRQARASKRNGNSWEDFLTLWEAKMEEDRRTQQRMANAEAAALQLGHQQLAATMEANAQLARAVDALVNMAAPMHSMSGTQWMGRSPEQ